MQFKNEKVIYSYQFLLAKIYKSRASLFLELRNPLASSSHYLFAVDFFGAERPALSLLPGPRPGDLKVWLFPPLTQRSTDCKCFLRGCSSAKSMETQSWYHRKETKKGCFKFFDVWFDHSIPEMPCKYLPKSIALVGSSSLQDQKLCIRKKSRHWLKLFGLNSLGSSTAWAFANRVYWPSLRIANL